MLNEYDDNFYDKIEKPNFQPPKWIFKYVWGVLFLLMAVSFILVVLKPASMWKNIALGVFFVQLAVNFYWTKVFFKDHELKKALSVAILLTVLVLAMIILFFTQSFLAGFLQIPYFLWLVFACILNRVLVILNK